MNTEITFPALCIGNTSIDRLNYQYLVSGKKFMHVAYKNVSIIDTQGNCFEMEGVEHCGGISIIDSIQNFGTLFKVKPKLKIPVHFINVIDFRNKIAETLKRNPKMLLNMQIAEIRDLGNYHTYIDLINLF